MSGDQARLRLWILIGLLGGFNLGCREDGSRGMIARPDTLPPIGEIRVTDAALPGGVNEAVLRSQADELDRHVTQLRGHIGTMRQISPRMAATVMQEHETHVRAIAERIQLQRRALPVPDHELSGLLGMNPDEYRVLMEESQIAAAEVVQLRTADETTIREQMPGHLARLDRIAGQLEHAAAALRR